MIGLSRDKRTHAYRKPLMKRGPFCCRDRKSNHVREIIRGKRAVRSSKTKQMEVSDAAEDIKIVGSADVVDSSLDHSFVTVWRTASHEYVRKSSTNHSVAKPRTKPSLPILRF